jgi:hypothetical protein
MLSKRVCESCNGGNQSFAEDWDDGIVWCSELMHLAMWRGLPACHPVKDDPPKECRFKLEHLVDVE